MSESESKPAARRWSLAAKLAAAWALSLGAAVGIANWVAHEDSGRRLLKGLTQEVERDAGEVQLRLETWARAFQEDARSSSQSPLVGLFLEHLGTPEEERWRGLLEGEFRSVFAGKGSYFQMRLLAAGEDGQELVRLDRKGGELEVTAMGNLQSKGGRAYFRDALALRAGEVYLSEISLNRDFGEITLPRIPTMRAAVKVSGGGAILVINADMRPVFEELRRLVSPASELRIFGADGGYVLHPEPGVSFARDVENVALPDDGLASVVEVGVPQPGGGKITAVVTLAEREWLPQLQRSQRRAVGVAFLAALVGAAVAFLVSLPFTARLRRLSTALRQFDASAVPEAFPEPGNDEIGTAIERFREMASKVGDEVTRLHAARHEAEAADRAKEEFLAVMSHEIRTPMNAVVGLIRALEANRPPAHQAPILSSLKTSSASLMTLLDTALDYTRLREGAVEYVVEEFDASGVVREVCASFEPAAIAKGLQLKCSAPKWLGVRGDAVRFRQVVNNLASNAVKFTEEGFVGISVEHDGERLLLSVEDSGVGIEEANLANVFEPFETSGAGGAGLGLAVTKRLVEQQGGEVALSTEAGKGARFEVWLPYEACELGEGSSVVRGVTIPDGVRILYAEDVLSNQQVMALTLDGSGCELVCADSGRKALELAGRKEFDIALLDLQLGDMGGIELAGELAKVCPELPMVAVTAQSSDETRLACRDVGIGAVVIKPFSAEEIFEAITNAVCLTDHSEVFLALHPGNEKKARALAKTMAGEMRSAASYLLSGRDAAEIRHKLKTAISRFELDGLDAVLVELEASPTDAGKLRTAASLLEEAAIGMER